MDPMHKELQLTCRVLRELGYRPVIVGTYALILQGWLPKSYIIETKDIDIFVDDPAIVFDDRFEKKVIGLGFNLGRSEVGGIYIDTEKPIEVLYPIHDIFIPKNLLRYIITISEMEVLEGHAVLVAKSLAGDIKHLAHTIKQMNVKVDMKMLRRLLEDTQNELDPNIRHIVARRIDEFIREFQFQKATKR